MTSFTDSCVRTALLEEGNMMSGDEASAPPVASAQKTSNRGIPVVLHDADSKLSDSARLLFTLGDGASWADEVDRISAQEDVDSLNIFADTIATISRSIKVPNHLRGHVVHDLRSVLCNLHKLRIGRGMDAEEANQLAVDTINICTGLITETLKILPRDIGPEELARVFVFGNAALDRTDCSPRHISVKGDASRINNALLIGVARIVASKLLSFTENKHNVRHGRRTERVYRFSDLVRNRITEIIEKAREELKECDSRLKALLQSTSRRTLRTSRTSTKSVMGGTIKTHDVAKSNATAKEHIQVDPILKTVAPVVKTVDPAVKTEEGDCVVAEKVVESSTTSPDDTSRIPPPPTDPHPTSRIPPPPTDPHPTSRIPPPPTDPHPTSRIPPPPTDPHPTSRIPPPPTDPHPSVQACPPQHNYGYHYHPVPPQPRFWVPVIDKHTGMYMVDGMGKPMWHPMW